jgi:hypothetical protein
VGNLENQQVTYIFENNKKYFEIERSQLLVIGRSKINIPEDKLIQNQKYQANSIKNISSNSDYDDPIVLEIDLE